MTRRDYILIADALRAALALVNQFGCQDRGSPDLGHEARMEGLALAVTALAEQLKAANPRFNRAMFNAHIIDDYPHLDPPFNKALAKVVLWNEAKP